ELLVKEIHHRVKNNLQIISSLLDMRSMRSRDPEVCKVLEDAQTKIYNMALIHTQLYQSQPFDRINMERHVEDLFGYLLEVYAHMKNKIVTAIDCSNVFLPVTQAIPCGVIINELLSNVFKHAFTNRQNGKIEIYMKNSGDNGGVIKIKDNGIGIPKEMDIKRLDSLGLKLVVNLVHIQLKGKMEIRNNGGTEVTIRF
ncbi:MAG: sensor histidine kinase, partial [Desulfobacterales bacterium]